MTEQEKEQPQIYLITPPEFELSSFGEQLAQILDDVDIACLRLRLATDDIDTIGRTADVIRDICHQREVPIVIDTHFRLVETHGLDGVHLTDGPKQLRYVREELGNDAIIGAYCGASRHNGMNAAEIGADYVSFGPMNDTGLGGGDIAEFETFEWWSQVVEVPVVAEGALTLETAKLLAPVTDFIALGSEVWNAEAGAKVAIQEFLAQLS